ncbi:MAG: AMP-binding protein, partial [Gammaproteobacteria bacterium]|nr:AMP-binding protein [Gammaproteobacteria bacterium]
PLGIHPVGQIYSRCATSRGITVNWAGSGTSTPSALQLDLIQRLKPTVWLGMSSYALHLANLAEARGVDLTRLGIEHVMCSAEPVSQAKRDKIERCWGAKLTDNFGMTEAGMMGSEDVPGQGFRIWSDMYFVEVLDPKTLAPAKEGEVGTLVVTSLWTNSVTPFLRWSSGDLVTYSEADDHSGPFAVFPRVRHAHRTAGFFKIRGINLGHQDLEDFMFRHVEIGDFRAEAVNEGRQRHPARLDRGAAWHRRERRVCAPGAESEGAVRAGARDRGARNRHAGARVRSQRQGRAVRRSARLAVMPFDAALADRIRKALAGRKGVTEKRMFGGVCFLIEGSMCCGVVKDDLCASVGPDRYAEALSRPHARPMDFTGRPLKGFVYVAPAGVRTAAALAKWLDWSATFARPLRQRSRSSSVRRARVARNRKLSDQQVGDQAREQPEGDRPEKHRASRFCARRLDPAPNQGSEAT